MWFVLFMTKKQVADVVTKENNNPFYFIPV